MKLKYAASPLVTPPGFRDEALSGDWKGHGSSRLSKQYSVIYRVHGNRLNSRVPNMRLNSGVMWTNMYRDVSRDGV